MLWSWRVSKSVLAALRGVFPAVVRPLIAYLPLLVVTLYFRGDDVKLALASRFFVWFSLIAAFASQGLGGYLYAINVASSARTGFQSIKLLASLRRGVCGWWALLGLAAAFLSLILFVGLPVGPGSFLVALMSVLLGPLLLVSMQHAISTGLLLRPLSLSLLQSAFLFLTVVCVMPGQEYFPGWAVLPSFFLLTALTVVSFRFIGRIKLNSMRRLWSLEPFRGSLHINRSSRLKCFLDALLPPVYTVSILTYLSWNELPGLSEGYQVAFYSYSRISDALISALVVFFTYLFRENRTSNGVREHRQSFMRISRWLESGSTPLWLVELLFILIVSAAALGVGYAYNCKLVGVCHPRIIAFDFAISIGKLFAIIGSFFFVIMIPRLSLCSQLAGLAVSASLMFSPLDIGAYMVAFAASFWILQLLLPALSLFRRRSR